MLLQAPDQWRVTAIVNFCVWDMPGMNMILGLPVALDYFQWYWWPCRRQCGEMGSLTQKQIQYIMVSYRNEWCGRCDNIGQCYERFPRCFFTLDSVVGWRFSGRRGDSYAVFVFWTDVLSEQSRTRRCLVIILCCMRSKQHQTCTHELISMIF